MPKKKRVWYPGAIYHIMSRGNRRSDLFRDEEDFQVYLTIIEEAQEKYKFTLFTYCLMTNHVHLQFQTGEHEVWKIMRTINLFYAKYFNNKYNFIGHLFQGRYKSRIIKKDSHNIATSRYIHLNPVRAKMVDKPLDYKWSSYGVYLGEKDCDILDKNKILSYFKDNSSRLYQEYVESQLIILKEDSEIEKSMEVN